MKTKTGARRKNRADATLRNVTAANKRLAQLERAMKRALVRIRFLEDHQDAGERPIGPGGNNYGDD